MNWVDYLVPFGTAAGGAASVYGLVVRPRQKEHEKHEAQRREQEKEQAELRRRSDAFMYGMTPIEGVTEGALSAPVRLKAVEEQTRQVVKGQALLEKRMNEANGTSRDIKKMLQEIVEAGVTTKLDLQGAANGVAEIQAESQAALLHAIHHPDAAT